jgi:hypothetical protein
MLLPGFAPALTEDDVAHIISKTVLSRNLSFIGLCSFHYIGVNKIRTATALCAAPSIAALGFFNFMFAALALAALHLSSKMSGAAPQDAAWPTTLRMSDKSRHQATQMSNCAAGMTAVLC